MEPIATRNSLPVNTNFPRPSMNKISNFLGNVSIIEIAIFFAVILKVFGLVPLIIQVSKNKSAEDISIATPIMFLGAFSILCVISFMKGMYGPFFLFLIGAIVAIVLLLQKILYERSKTSIVHEESNRKTDFEFPDPKLE